MTEKGGRGWKPPLGPALNVAWSTAAEEIREESRTARVSPLQRDADYCRRGVRRFGNVRRIEVVPRKDIPFRPQEDGRVFL